MNELEIRSKVLEIVSAHIEDKEIITEQADEDLLQHVMDSIKFITIIVALEETFEIEVPDENLLITEMGTVNKMVNVITEALQNKG